MIGPNGEEYGPADLATLAEWRDQARVFPTTILKDSASGQTLQASSIPALFPPVVQQPTQVPIAPVHTNYPRDLDDLPAGRASLMKAYLLLILAPCCCVIFYYFAWKESENAYAYGIERGTYIFRGFLIALVALQLVALILRVSGVFSTAQ